jgi:hypothetical protein
MEGYATKRVSEWEYIKQFDHKADEGKFHMNCGINGAKDQISKEMKNRCSI